MWAIYWVLFAIAVLAALGCISATWQVLRYFRHPPDMADSEAVSVIVPLKGADAKTGSNLQALLESDIRAPIEFLFAMETEHDPAYALCAALRDRYMDKAIRIVITGAAGARMGKQHNLIEAVKVAQHGVIGSMDADVRPHPQAIAQALRALRMPGAGVAFFLPYYAGHGPLGGSLVGFYANYYFSLYVGSLAALQWAPVNIGSMWFVDKATLEKIGGLESLAAFASDDAALGRAVARVGLKNRMVRMPVQIAFETLDLRGGIKHMQKWLAMLRAEGLANYLVIFISWHSAWLSCMAVLVEAGSRGTVGRASAALLLSSIAIKIASILLLNRLLYRGMSTWRFVWAVLPYEIGIAPWLFLIGLFKRSLVWRGRKYRIGKHGRIISIEEA